MNIFYLDEDVFKAAQYHMDRHVRKMIIEYAQLLSTAHRVLDGEEQIDVTDKGRKIRRWYTRDWRDEHLYKSTHINHPSSKWVRGSAHNYAYLYNLFCALCDEFVYRFGKHHATDTKLRKALSLLPKNISWIDMTSIPQAMDKEYRLDNSLDAYRNYYINGKSHLAQWTKREKPDWYVST